MKFAFRAERRPPCPFVLANCTIGSFTSPLPHATAELPGSSLLVALVSTSLANLSAQSNYTWNNVRIVAGGFVPGIVYHPNAQGLVYARTDIGGLYKSTNGGANWTPRLDWVNWSN